jgi:pimeloyl-ACP methyl ester carboxylesterase
MNDVPHGRKHVVTLLGSKLHYWVYGPLKGAPVIVAVHGFRGTHHGLERVVANSPQYTWIVPDLPGFGESTAMSGPAHDVSGYVHLLREFIPRVTRPEEDVILLGHSFGSIVAASVATDPPANVHRLIMVNPIARRPQIIGRLGTMLYFTVGCSLKEQSARRYFSNSFTVDAMSLALTKTKDLATRAYVKEQHRVREQTDTSRLVQSKRESYCRGVHC